MTQTPVVIAVLFALIGAPIGYFIDGMEGMLGVGMMAALLGVGVGAWLRNKFSD